MIEGRYSITPGGYSAATPFAPGSKPSSRSLRGSDVDAADSDVDADYGDDSDTDDGNDA